MARKRKAFGFIVGEKVVYPSHGVGQIDGIVSQNIGGSKEEMFVIHFESEGLTLRIPINRVPEVGLRNLVSEEELTEALGLLNGRARVKKSMWSRRAIEYDQKINSGCIIKLTEVVRDLNRPDPNKDQSYSERQLFEEAYGRLTKEVAAVKQISILEAKEVISDNLLHKKSKTKELAA
ncbi:MAG: CarD family transcriptional regulator [Paracoccaceae bacterium]|nr:CarD family transcriptional regulator [Paracoccaceae bacterium]MDE2675404.1 CarD family transcriptional regulator [Paracoccaceae bacterium]